MPLNFKCTAYLALLIGSCAIPCFAQISRPGLTGMAPSKWITIKNTQAPGRTYKFDQHPLKTYIQEDIFFKMWLPLVHRSKISVIAGPQYRTEQFELQGEGENPVHQLSNWNLRSMGLDLKSCISLDTSKWLMLTIHANQSGNLHDQPQNGIPLNYSISTVYIKKTSDRREFGFGFIANRTFGQFSVLPIFIYHYNYSPKAGLEINLPYRISWRHNLTSKDILYVKSEALSRSYFIVQDAGNHCRFRKTDLDLGVSYNKQFSKYFGTEVFAGYRWNLRQNLPEGVTPIKTSGLAMSLEIYIKPPLSKQR
ncbi:MAG: DUF6268 family outer membrane beta-barrel protein [Bacteroidota bacterium]